MRDVKVHTWRVGATADKQLVFVKFYITKRIAIRLKLTGDDAVKIGASMGRFGVMVLEEQKGEA